MLKNLAQWIFDCSKLGEMVLYRVCQTQFNVIYKNSEQANVNWVSSKQSLKLLQVIKIKAMLCYSSNKLH